MASADELILQMQHLAAQARAQRDSSAARKGLDRLKSSAQKLAYEKQTEVDTLEQTITGAEDRLVELKKDGVQGLEAKEYLALSDLIEASKKQLVKSRAQLQFALDRMEVVERREYEAFHAEVRAEHHGSMADDPLSNKG
jgi:hypothetical protein